MKQFVPQKPPEQRRHRIKPLSFSRSELYMAIIFGCLLLSTVLPQIVTGVIVLLVSVLLIRKNELYLVYPAMLFYYESLGQLMGMSVYRYFSLIFLGYELLGQKRIRWRRSHWLLLGIYTAYAICVILPVNTRKAAFFLVDIICMLMLTEHHLSKPGKRRRFFTVFALTALCSFVTGVLMANTTGHAARINGQYVVMARNNATFEDPNYMGFFFTTAVFATVTLKLFSPRLRVLIVCALYIMMFTTLSMTMIVVNVLLWLAYLFLAKKVGLKVLVCIGIVIAILVGAYTYGLLNPDTPVLGMLSYRISDKLMQAEAGDINALTTNRTGLTMQHLDYFWNQSFFRMLVGMNAASPVHFNLEGIRGIAHNEYVDLLLNVGIIGAVIFISYIAQNFVKARRQRNRLGQDNTMFLYMVKLIWVLYAMTLTFFGDHRFMLLLFL